MRRKILMGVFAFALPLGLLAGLSTAASAHAPKPPKYSGPALGQLTCTSFAIKVTFSPPLKVSTGGASTKIKGSAGGCTANAETPGVTETISSVKVTGTSTSSTPGGTGCLGLGNGGSESITAKLKGTLAGSVGGTTYGGKATFTNGVVTYNSSADVTVNGDVGFNIPSPINNGYLAGNGGSVTGSFAGTIGGGTPGTETNQYGNSDTGLALSTETATALTPACTSTKGLKDIVLSSGHITLP